MAKQIVKKSSDAYGYSYASLEDIVNQGFEIPQMRVKPTEYGDYIEYKDEEGWHIGARIVIPEMKGKNSAQMYGAGLTYARRYTAMNALRLVCGDDKDVETVEKPVENSVSKYKLTEKRIKLCGSIESLMSLWRTFTEEEQLEFRDTFSKRKKELEDMV